MLKQYNFLFIVEFKDENCLIKKASLVDEKPNAYSQLVMEFSEAKQFFRFSINIGHCSLGINAFPEFTGELERFSSLMPSLKTLLKQMQFILSFNYIDRVKAVQKENMEDFEGVLLD